MSLQYNPYLWHYLFAALFVLGIMVYAEYKRVVDRLLTLVQVMTIIWGLGFAVQISATDLKTSVFWYLLANDFVGFKIPVIWFFWSLVVAGRRKWLTKTRVLWLLAIPLCTDLLNLTNRWHGLMYQHWNLNLTGRYPSLEFKPGLWYWVVTIYCGVILLAVIAVQLRAAFNREFLYWKQGLFTAVATAAVLIQIVLSLTIPAFWPYDPTPVVISFAVVLSSIVSRFRIQEAVPVPRNMILEKMVDAALILDNRDRVMDLNPAAEAFFGIKISQVAGLNFTEALTGWPEIAAAGRDKTDAIWDFTRDGRYFEARFSVMNDGYKNVGRMLVVQDVTAAKKAEAQLAEQQQALGILRERERLARELHDSLGQVLGYTQMQIKDIREKMKNGEIEVAEDSLARLAQVILEANTEIREFIYEVKSSLLFKNGFFGTLKPYLDRFARNFKIKIETENPDRLTDEEIDLAVGVQLFRIIQEALTNVRKHARADQVRIIFRKTAQQIEVEVTDNGIGFDPQSLTPDRLSFGLEVMRERAFQVGGKIRIEAAPGRGTTVKIKLPRIAREENRPEQEAGGETTAGRKKIRVLLVDDHALFIEGLRNLISSHGFEVVGTARDGLEALLKARLLQPELILMDLTMPRCNGLTATRLIKAEMPEVKIVILSMSDQDQDLLAAIKNGANGYLLKGLRPEDLLEELIALASGLTTISSEMAAQVLEEISHQERGENTGQESGQSVQLEPERILSPKQVEILRLVALGDTYKEVAAKLDMTERMVKYQMAQIIKELHLQNRAQAIAYARQAGLGNDPAAR